MNLKSDIKIIKNKKREKEIVKIDNNPEKLFLRIRILDRIKRKISIVLKLIKKMKLQEVRNL